MREPNMSTQPFVAITQPQAVWKPRRRSPWTTWLVLALPVLSLLAGAAVSAVQHGLL